MRRWAAAVVLGMTLLLSPPVGAAEGPTVSPEGVDGIAVTDGRAGGAAAPRTTRRDDRRARGRPVTLVLRPVLRWNPATGRYCLHVGREPGDPASTETASREAALIGLSRRFGRCPAPVRRSSGGSPTSPFGATSWRELVSLPEPSLRFAPGSAITGLPGCLEIAGPADFVRDVVTPFGSLVRLQVTSTYDIDWGDGSAGLTRTTERGAPCPDGRLRHTYRWRGDVTVTVVQRWRAAWTTAAGGRGGRIAEELRTVARLVLPVREVQAVGTG